VQTGSIELAGIVVDAGRNRFRLSIQRAHSMNRKSLSDILSGGSGDNINNLWNSTDAADEFRPLPPGKYVCHWVEGELTNSTKKGTPGYKLTFKVIEGEHTGRKLWHDIWLTPASMSMAKRDLSRLGITSPQQLEQPVPRWHRCLVTVVLRRDDDGTERNSVKTFEVTGKDEPEADPFAPKTEG
jgi:hypothetical protein